VTFDAQRAADLLIAARRDFRQVALPAPAPANTAEAYAVQKIVAAACGTAAGWKVGAKSTGETPNTSPLFSPLVRQSPCQWSANELHMIGIEAELAFRLGRDVTSRNTVMTADEVWNSITSVHAAIEVVDTRIADWKNVDRLWLLADNQANGGFVFSPSGKSLSGGSYADAEVRLTINDKIAVEARGGNPAGDPRWLVEWCVDHVARERGGLRAGDFITTGSYTGMIFVEPGATVSADFPTIGRADVTFR
jgi:2-keto-4-pentenoate hydratase